LVISAIEKEFAADYLIPAAFFSVGSVAFAYLLRQVAKYKMRQYYEPVMWLYLVAFHLFFAFVAQANFLFYYTVVVLAAYMVQLSLDRYIIMALGELVCYMALVVKSGTTEIPVEQFLVLAAVHLFAFCLSRDFYNTNKNFLIEERKLRREMQEAEHDPLTGLINRRGLERRVEESWKSSKNRQEAIAAFVIDIDFFKSYNDRFGHVQGDVCIQRVAQSIADTVKGYGIAARIGGEEFFVFVRGGQVHEINNLAEQIRRNVEAMQITRGNVNGGVITVSIGYDIRYATDEVSLQGLYGRADRALFRAKQEGRNCIRSSYDLRERRSKIG
jgi:diguanylate cyclase (GGDEF)-like protein